MESTEDISNTTCDDKNTKKERRHRRKQLINLLRQQMEFYLSSANINKDRFIKSLFEDGPYVDLELFLTKFNKIKSLTTEVKHLVKAVESSSFLELSEDKTKVKRSIPVQVKENEIDCTLYVENLPSIADHDYIRQIFSQYGTIDYISLPRFKQCGRPKGFAFIEFDCPESAQKALKSFISSEINPEELISIKAYQKENENLNAGDAEISEQSLQDKNNATDITKNEEMESDNLNKGCKRERNDIDEESESKKLKTEPSTSSPEKSAKEDNECSSSEVPEVQSKKKKKKRKRNKKHEKDLDIHSIHLRVMSKSNWKKLRNKYLNIQRKNYKELKLKMIQKQQSYNEHYKNEAPPKIPTSVSIDTAKTKKAFKPEFIAGVIVKITFENNPQDPKKLRDNIKENGGPSVAYIEANNLQKDVFVRFHTSEGAQNYLKTASWTKMCLLKDDDEKEYWEHVIKSWESGRNKNKTGKKNDEGSESSTGVTRGKDKLIQKAFKKSENQPRLNTRVVFED